MLDDAASFFDEGLRSLRSLMKIGVVFEFPFVRGSTCLCAQLNARDVLRIYSTIFKYILYLVAVCPYCCFSSSMDPLEDLNLPGLLT